MRRNDWWLVSAITLSLLCWQAPAVAQSAKPAAQARGYKLKQIETEASMMLTGRLEVAADGTVASHEVDDRELLPKQVLRYLDAQVAKWRVEWGAELHEPVATSLPFSARLVATPDGDVYRLRVAGAELGDMPGDPAARISKRGALKLPIYPPRAAEAQATGTVYVLLKINREGRVEDTLVEQVNLNVIAYESVLVKLRKLFSDAVIEAARSWEFEVPRTGPDANAPYFAVRVPASFQFQGAEVPYGKWEQYVPGERRFAEWAHYRDDDTGIDGGASGKLYLVGAGPRLVWNGASGG